MRKLLWIISVDYFALFSKYRNDSDKTIKLLKHIEQLFADSKAAYYRKKYLITLFKLANNRKLTRKYRRIINSKLSENPLSGEMLTACIKKGFINAYWDKDITIEEIVRLAHSIDGMDCFTEELVLVPGSLRAKCWANALKAPKIHNSIEIYLANMLEQVQNDPQIVNKAITDQQSDKWCQNPIFMIYYLEDVQSGSNIN